MIISSVHVYTRNIIMIYMLYTTHIPYTYTHLDISPPKSMAFGMGNTWRA
jgi:hypothetical protein